MKFLIAVLSAASPFIVPFPFIILAKICRPSRLFRPPSPFYLKLESKKKR